MRSAMSANAPVPDDHVFEIPAKLIRTIADMKLWERSEAYYEYLGFILAINDAVKGKSNSRGSQHVSEEVDRVVAMLDRLDNLIEEAPPVQQPQRFGNVAFRAWYQKVKDSMLVLIQEVVGIELVRVIPEIGSYLIDSFGNSTRIDYGTGHEIAFLMFLCCLFKIGLLKESDKVGVGCKIFPRYLDLARKLQVTYRMEPAGSHGVWSLDDYQFVPFIWGSSQLFAHPQIEPPGFLLPQILNQYGDDYMFLTCIKYINSVKTGPFAEHSNQLWSISGVSSWSKINGGLIKMYKAEVLSKFPVIQHVVFGSLLTLKPMEQCTGFMSPKTSMVRPPVPLLRPDDSTSSHKSSVSSKMSDNSAQSSEEIVSSLRSSSKESVKSGPSGSASSSEKSVDEKSSTKINEMKGAESAESSSRGTTVSEHGEYWLEPRDTKNDNYKRGSELSGVDDEIVITNITGDAPDNDNVPKSISKMGF